MDLHLSVHILREEARCSKSAGALWSHEHFEIFSQSDFAADPLHLIVLRLARRRPVVFFDN